MFEKFDSFDGVCFFNGLVFFAPVALFIRTQAGVSETVFFLLQALLSVAIFLGEIPTGLVTDKIGYRKSIIMSETLMFIARGLILLAFIRKSLILFIAEAIVEGIANCFSSGTNSAYLFNLYGEEGFVKKSAHSANYGTAGFIISTLAYAGIYKYFGMLGLLLATLCAGFVGVIFSVFLASEKNGEKEDQGRTSIRGLLGILRSRRARRYIVLLSVFSVAWLLVNFFFVEKLELAGISAEWMSAIILVYSAVQMLAEPIINLLDKINKKTLLIVFGVVCGILMIVFGFVGQEYVVLGLMILLPLMITLPEYFLMDQENKMVDELGMEDNRAASLSVLNMGVNIVEIVALFASAALSGIGITWCFLLIGLGMILCTLTNIFCK